MTEKERWSPRNWRPEIAYAVVNIPGMTHHYPILRDLADVIIRNALQKGAGPKHCTPETPLPQYASTELIGGLNEWFERRRMRVLFIRLISILIITLLLIAVPYAIDASRLGGLALISRAVIISVTICMIWFISGCIVCWPRKNDNSIRTGCNSSDKALRGKTDELRTLFCATAKTFLLHIHTDIVNHVLNEHGTTPGQRLYYLIRPILVRKAREILELQADERGGKDVRTELERIKARLKSYIDMVVASGAHPFDRPVAPDPDNTIVAERIRTDVFRSAEDDTYNSSIHAYQHQEPGMPILVKQVGDWPAPQNPNNTAQEPQE